MTAQVHIRVHQPLDGETIQHGAIVEIRSADARGHRERVSVPVGEDSQYTTTVNLVPGNYELTATLPSGSVVSDALRVGPDDQDLQIAMYGGSSPHEYLAWQRWTGNVADGRAVERLKNAFWPGIPKIPLAFSQVTVRWWRKQLDTSTDGDPVWSLVSDHLTQLEATQSGASAWFQPAGYSITGLT